jgi:hypothetical protein
MTTGLGSVDVYLLSKVWPMSASALLGSGVAVQPANASVAAGTNDVVTITVTSQTGSTVPTGSVTLQIDGGTNCGGVATTCGGTTVANQSLNASGQVTYTANFTAAGTHQVLAQYAGDATHAPATGVGVIIVTGSGGSGSFKTTTSPSTLTVSSGSSGTETLTVTPANGYTGTVGFMFTLSSSALTSQNFCIFETSGFDSNGNLQVSGTAPASGQLQIDTNGSDCSSASTGALKGHGMRMVPRKGSGVAANSKPKSSLPGGGLALAGLLLAGLLGRASRKLRGLACMIALAAVMFGVSACGSSSGGPANAPKGTYTITFQGQDSVTTTLTSQSTFTLVIN